MQFLKLAHSGNNSFRLYLGGFALIILSYIIGSLPLVVDAMRLYPNLNPDLDDPIFIQNYGSTRLLAGMLYPFVLVFIALVLYLYFAHQRTLRSMFSAAATFRWNYFFGFAFVLLLFIISLTLLELYVTQDFNRIAWNFESKNFWILLAVSIFLVPFQIAAEELVFRVYILQGLYLRTKNASLSIFLSALMFAVLHIENPEIESLGFGLLLYYFMAGFFLSVISIKSSGLELALAFHLINNLFGIVFFSSDWQVFHTDALFLDHRPPSSLILTLGTGLFSFLFLYFILAKKLGWKLFNLQD